MEIVWWCVTMNNDILSLVALAKANKPLSVEIPEKGMSNTYDTMEELLNETIEIPTDSPVTEITLNMPEVATKLNHFDIYVELSAPTNAHTAGNSMIILFNKQVWYWSMGNTLPTQAMHLWILVDTIRKISFYDGLKSVPPYFNVNILKALRNIAPSYTESEKKANNTFKFQLDNEYAGTAKISVRGYR